MRYGMTVGAGSCRLNGNNMAKRRDVTRHPWRAQPARGGTN